MKEILRLPVRYLWSLQHYHPISRDQDEAMNQNYLIIWVDDNMDPANVNCQNIRKKLQDIVNDMNLCTTPAECIQLLNDLRNGKVFVISFGTVGKHLVSDIHSRSQLDAIYIFCSIKIQHQH
ncbi:unnamed protein product [Rotaria magnacalcarata]|uniref:Uncharacterized protein n=2 Tax=Rotaria magnacalcarata TaxID=392030 RepID=A0A816RQQ7_9BILA|nr:unnamed protein product [Rotaria magnacalcarata]